MASVFANNGERRAWRSEGGARAVLTDPEALRRSRPTDGRLKDPVLHMIGLGRALGRAISDPNQFMYVFSNLSQRVLTPTTVFSFYSPLATLPGHTDLYGPEFQIYPPALAIQRANFIYRLAQRAVRRRVRGRSDAVQGLGRQPAALVDQVNQTLMFGRMSTDLRELIIVATNAVPASDHAQRALGALLSRGDLQRVLGVRRQQRRRRHGRAAADGARHGVHRRESWSRCGGSRRSIGPAPTGYVFEAGMQPGEVLASMPDGEHDANVHASPRRPDRSTCACDTVSGGDQEPPVE